MKLRAFSFVAAASLLVSSASAQLTASDVQTIINHAVTRAVTISSNSVIAVTDREGDVLGVWVMRGGNATNPEVATAVSKAGTKLSTWNLWMRMIKRTTRFIIHSRSKERSFKRFEPGKLKKQSSSFRLSWKNFLNAELR